MEMMEITMDMDLIGLSQYRSFQARKQSKHFKDSLLKVNQELLSKLKELKDDLAAKTETPDDLSHVRMYYKLRKL